MLKQKDLNSFLLNVVRWEDEENKAAIIRVSSCRDLHFPILFRFAAEVASFSFDRSIFDEVDTMDVVIEKIMVRHYRAVLYA